MTTSNVAVTQGSGKNLATNSISEDAITKELSRIVVNNSTGTEVTFNTNGQAVMASSAPTVLASNHTTLAVASDTAQIANGASGTYLTPATAKVSIAAATTTTVVAAVAGKKIRILALYLVAGGAVNINWQSHTTTSNGDAALDIAANSGIVLNFNPVGWFDTTSGEALDIVTSAASQLSGRIVYVAV